LKFISDAQRRAVMSKFSKNNSFALYYAPGYRDDKNYKRILSDEYPGVDFTMHNLSDRVSNKNLLDSLSIVDERHLADLSGLMVVPRESEWLGKQMHPFGFYNFGSKNIVMPDRGIYDKDFPVDTLVHEVGHHVSHIVPKREISKGLQEPFAEVYKYNTGGEAQDEDWFVKYRATPKMLDKVAYVESIKEATNPSIKQQMKYARIENEV